ncbi:hypothetical protein [Motilimonas pumila]|uniref:Uncharacterized protein n=1 Tax=Motilimonas pumila TaxID=2303987 RepID=A0A418YB44_9GAMM|nr:hypothetical protein [Motilimonas pumila]RJG40198.1 hypothetical protein D1Z90_16800 [Motilimonas pumila]
MHKNRIVAAVMCCLSGLSSPLAVGSEIKMATRAVLTRYEHTAFALMKQSYRHYLSLHGRCQESEQETECEQSFTQAKIHYMATKANWDVMQLLEQANSYQLALSPSVYPSLGHALNELGYQVKTDHVSERALLSAIADWSEDHGVPETDRVFLLHWVLIQTDWYALRVD